MQYLSRSPRAGFTLIELLVVISIIALLIAILLPSLEKARNAARTMGCLANKRQISLAIGMYQTTSNGYMMPGTSGTHGGATNPQSRIYWYGFLEDAVGGQAWRANNGVGTQHDWVTLPMWFCPESQNNLHNRAGSDFKSATYYSGSHYKVNQWFYVSNNFTATGGDTLSYREQDVRDHSLAMATIEHNTPSGVNVRPYSFDPVNGPWAYTAYIGHNNGGNALFFDGHAKTHKNTLDEPLYRAQTPSMPIGYKAHWRPWSW